MYTNDSYLEGSDMNNNLSIETKLAVINQLMETKEPLSDDSKEFISVTVGEALDKLKQNAKTAE
ncbi:hypothetical protein VF_A0670 [Aliivibrio fischeri ES114]|uniref:Uncharacterized protein n=2 Tax=Aliivibrio fischeri TaxID=668 RepID=Q5DZQ6_ALIF1|nr:hypothetical protein [Aliivibrio fischeri]AAW87740.1 hypothetical protein VF_A0670 [Aliivibrio fischeri ES114]